MDIFNNYFQSLIFQKVEQNNTFTIYGAHIHSMLGNNKKRYILVFVRNEYASKEKSKIKDLEWESIQTRTLSFSQYRLPPQRWVIPRDSFDLQLVVKNRNKKYTEYSSENFPFEILILHDPNKKTLYQYRNSLNLTAAVELFNSVFKYTGDFQTSYSDISPVSGSSSITTNSNIKFL